MANDNQPDSLIFQTISGLRIEDYADDAAHLRVSIFEQWPYLYAGNLDYDCRYLQGLGQTNGAVMVLARARGKLVGVSIGLPLEREDKALQSSMRALGHDPKSWFYLAESAVLPQYRGRGAGHAFFDAREAHARTLGFDKTCFSAVVRPDNDPQADPSARPLDGFWHGRGYRPVKGAVAEFSWTDSGADEKTKKQLQMWAKS